MIYFKVTTNYNDEKKFSGSAAPTLPSFLFLHLVNWGSLESRYADWFDSINL
jgi:hypothetical protein